MPNIRDREPSVEINWEEVAQEVRENSDSSWTKVRGIRSLIAAILGADLYQKKVHPDKSPNNRINKSKHRLLVSVPKAGKEDVKDLYSAIYEYKSTGHRTLKNETVIERIEFSRTDVVGRRQFLVDGTKANPIEKSVGMQITTQTIRRGNRVGIIKKFSFDQHGAFMEAFPGAISESDTNMFIPEIGLNLHTESVNLRQSFKLMRSEFSQKPPTASLQKTSRRGSSC